MKRLHILYALIISLFMSGCSSVVVPPQESVAPTQIATQSPASAQTVHDEYDYELIFPSDKYPETALHIRGAIEQGYSDVCTIDRDGAEENRKESLAGIDTRDGYDRDEWPMAMCAEGGKGASVTSIRVIIGELAAGSGISYRRMRMV